MRKSPCFFPKPQGMVQSLLAREDVSILAAFWKDTAVGYMAVDEEGETFVTLREDMLNICGGICQERISLGGRCKAASGRGGFDGAGARKNVSWCGL